MNEIDFTGRVAVVTGAGGGIGRAHALLLAARGASVVVSDVGGAAEVVAEIEAAGGSAVAATASIAEPEGGEAAVAAALEAYGRLDIVLHNAGILRDRSFARMSEADVSEVMAVHLEGAFNVLRPAWPVMQSQKYGRVLLTTSASGLFGTFGQANYAAAKAGLIGLMNVLAVEGARHGIQVNALSPTAATRMTEGLLGDLADRFDPAHIAPVAAYLVSERCALTHHILSAGGGRVARIFVGTTPGVYLGPEPATPEAVEAAMGGVLPLDAHVVPDDGTGEVALIRRALLGEDA